MKRFVNRFAGKIERTQCGSGLMVQQASVCGVGPVQIARLWLHLTIGRPVEGTARYRDALTGKFV